MLLEGIEIDDTVADRLLVAYGAEPEDFRDPDRRREALGLLLLHGLEILESATVAGDTGGHKKLETSLLALAGAPHTLPVEMDARGVPYQVWLPAVGWLSLAQAPDGWSDLESALSAVQETLAAHAALRTSATARRLPTNEEMTEMVFADVASVVMVEARLDGRLFRFRLDPATALVTGIPLGDPEAVPERR